MLCAITIWVVYCKYPKKKARLFEAKKTLVFKEFHRGKYPWKKDKE